MSEHMVSRTLSSFGDRARQRGPGPTARLPCRAAGWEDAGMGSGDQVWGGRDGNSHFNNLPSFSHWVAPTALRIPGHVMIPTPQTEEASSPLLRRVNSD